MSLVQEPLLHLKCHKPMSTLIFFKPCTATSLASTHTYAAISCLPRALFAPLPSFHRDPCLPWLRSWLTGTALLDGKGYKQAKQAIFCSFSLSLSKKQNKKNFPAQEPALLWPFVCLCVLSLSSNTQSV